MKTYIHTCCVCKKTFVSSTSRAVVCSNDCRNTYRAEQRRIKSLQNNETNLDRALKEYNEYCEKHGFVTYGKFKAMKTANALKEQRRAKNEQQHVEQ